MAVYRVLVRYGANDNAEYASVPSKESADKLAECAMKLGYINVRVRKRHASRVTEAEAEDGRGSAATSGVGKKARPVHGVRARPAPAPSGDAG